MGVEGVLAQHENRMPNDVYVCRSRARVQDGAGILLPTASARVGRAEAADTVASAAIDAGNPAGSQRRSGPGERSGVAIPIGIGAADNRRIIPRCGSDCPIPIRVEGGRQ